MLAALFRGRHCPLGGPLLFAITAPASSLQQLRPRKKLAARHSKVDSRARRYRVRHLIEERGRDAKLID